MQMFFCVQTEIVHPETREIVLAKHATYTAFEIESKRIEFGFDSFNAVVLFAESWEEACVLSFDRF